MIHTSLTGVLSSSPSLQLSAESEGAFTLSESSTSVELTMDTAVTFPYRSKTAYTFWNKSGWADCTTEKLDIKIYRSILVPSPLQWLLVPCLLHQWGCAWYHHCIFSPQHDFPPIVEGRCWGRDMLVLCLGVIRIFIYHSFSMCSCLYLCLAQLTEQRKWTGEDFHVNVMFQSKSVYQLKKTSLHFWMSKMVTHNSKFELCI